MHNQLKSLFFLFTAAIIWGLAFVAQTDTGTLGACTFLASRSFLGALTLVPVIFLLERNPKGDSGKILRTIGYGAIAGSILFLASLLQQIGININHNAGKAGFITALYSVLVPVFSFVIWRKKTGLQIWIGVFLSLLGLYFLTMTEGIGSINLGDLVILIATVFWAFHILTVNHCIDHVYPIRFSAVQFFTCGILALCFALLTENPSLTELPSATFAILFCGILSTGVAYTSQVLGQRNFDPTLASIILSTESLFSVIGGVLFLHERLTLQSALGCLLIFSGVIIAQLKSKKASS